MGPQMSGARIKAVRQALGLSQVEFAKLLGVSNVTVNRWEHDRAAPQPGTVGRILRLERDGPGALSDAPARRGNLPPVFVPLVGRGAELGVLASLVATRPLTTVVGPAGAGKTRLAVEIGHATASRWPDGVWFVDLAAAGDPGDVAHAVARVLGVREVGRKPLPDRLADELRSRTLLLILDNCEHLRTACAALAAALLAAGGASRLLATSRVPLDVPGESVSPLHPLAPADAAALFRQRALEHQPGLDPDADQVRAIGEICRRLDGLPLAIELAAARTAVLSVEQIAGRLDRRFDLLRLGGGSTAAPRQQALETAIAWSYDLLDADAAALFRQLGVFAGWFDLAAVEQVARRPNALDILADLVRQSMLVVEIDGASRAARYRLLESLTAFARDALARSGEADAAAARHAAYYAALARETAPALRGPRQPVLLARLDREHDNLIAALEWSLAGGDPAGAVAVAAALGPYWRLRGRYAEGIAWLERALAGGGDGRGMPGMGPSPPISRPEPSAVESRLEAANQLALLYYHAARLDDALDLLEATVDSGRERGDAEQEARALDTLGLVLVARRELPRAAAAHEAALALFRALGDRGRAAMSQLYLGNMANLRGEHRVAERAYREAWSLIQGSGDVAGEAQILSNLGEIAARTGRYARALGYYERTLALLRAVGDPARLAAVATNTAEVRLVLGEPAAAVPLAADAVTRFREIGHPAHLADALYVCAAARAAVGERVAALAHFREALALEQRNRDWIDSVYAIEGIARLFAEGGDPALAARLLGGLEPLREQHQVADYPLFDTAGTLAAVRAALGGEAMAAHWTEGRRSSPPEVVAEAMLAGEMADGDPIRVLRVPGSVNAPPRAGTLTPRQVDVLRLVATGGSNREIGDALAISDRTVERHLTAIYAILDVDRRSAAVARALALGLLPDTSL